METQSRQTMIATIRRHPRWLPVLIVAAAIVIMNFYSVSVAHAADPPGDCWNGVLSADPVHCYALEEVQRNGLIEVEGIYLGPGNRLYVYYVVTTESDFRLGIKIREKAIEFGSEHQSRVEFPDASDSFDYANCRAEEEGFEAIHECTVERTFWSDKIAPWVSPYAYIGLRGDGAESRLQDPGWASWTQLWPAVVSGSSDRGVRSETGTGRFDVSDVDMTNIDVVDIWEKRFPGLGVLARYPDRSRSAIYYEVKNPPDDAVELEALKQKLLPCYDTIGRCYDEFRDAYSHSPSVSEVIVVPVKYSYYDLARWTEILNRFAVSSGNTIGLVDVLMSTNATDYEDDLFPVEGFQRAELLPHWWDPATLRTTIRVGTYGDAGALADALPDLLPQLGIPVGSVGMVVDFYPGAGSAGVWVGGSTPSLVGNILGGDSSFRGSAGWVVMAAAGSVAGLLLIVAAFVTLRVRRNRRRAAAKGTT